MMHLQFIRRMESGVGEKFWRGIQAGHFFRVLNNGTGKRKTGLEIPEKLQDIIHR